MKQLLDLFIPPLIAFIVAGFIYTGVILVGLEIHINPVFIGIGGGIVFIVMWFVIFWLMQPGKENCKMLFK